MGIANPYYGGNFDKDDWERCELCGNIIVAEKHYRDGKTICNNCNKINIENKEILSVKTNNSNKQILSTKNNDNLNKQIINKDIINVNNWQIKDYKIRLKINGKEIEALFYLNGDFPCFSYSVKIDKDIYSLYSDDVCEAFVINKTRYFGNVLELWNNYVGISISEINNIILEKANYNKLEPFLEDINEYSIMDITRIKNNKEQNVDDLPNKNEINWDLKY